MVLFTFYISHSPVLSTAGAIQVYILYSEYSLMFYSMSYLACVLSITGAVQVYILWSESSLMFYVLPGQCRYHSPVLSTTSAAIHYPGVYLISYRVNLD